METFLFGCATGALVASVAGFKTGAFVERWKIEKEHTVLVAQNEAYEKILQVSNIRREIK